MRTVKIKNAIFAGYTRYILLIPLVLLVVFLLFLEYIPLSSIKLVFLMVIGSLCLLLYVIHKILLLPNREERKIIEKNIQNEWRALTKNELDRVKEKFVPDNPLFSIHYITLCIIIGISLIILPNLDHKPTTTLTYTTEFLIIVPLLYIFSCIIYFLKKQKHKRLEKSLLIAKVQEIPIIRTYEFAHYYRKPLFFLPRWLSPREYRPAKFGVFIFNNKKHVVRIPIEINKNNKIKIITFLHEVIILF